MYLDIEQIHLVNKIIEHYGDDKDIYNESRYILNKTLGEIIFVKEKELSYLISKTKYLSKIKQKNNSSKIKSAAFNEIGFLYSNNILDEYITNTFKKFNIVNYIPSDPNLMENFYYTKNFLKNLKINQINFKIKELDFNTDILFIDTLNFYRMIKSPNIITQIKNFLIYTDDVNILNIIQSMPLSIIYTFDIIGGIFIIYSISNKSLAV